MVLKESLRRRREREPIGNGGETLIEFFITMGHCGIYLIILYDLVPAPL